MIRTAHGKIGCPDKGPVPVGRIDSLGLYVVGIQSVCRGRVSLKVLHHILSSCCVHLAAADQVTPSSHSLHIIVLTTVRLSPLGFYFWTCFAYLRNQTQRLKYSQQTTQQLTHSKVSAIHTRIEVLGVWLLSYSEHLIYIPGPPPPHTHRRKNHGCVALLTYMGDEWSWNI